VDADPEAAVAYGLLNLPAVAIESRPETFVVGACPCGALLRLWAPLDTRVARWVSQTAAGYDGHRGVGVGGYYDIEVVIRQSVTTCCLVVKGRAPDAACLVRQRRRLW
jgi:hypothetical protein